MKTLLTKDSVAETTVPLRTRPTIQDLADPLAPVVVYQSKLAPRQMQTCRLIAEGHSNKEIAFRMGITPGTAKVYISSLMKRLNVGSRYELISLYFRHALAVELAAVNQQIAELEKFQTYQKDTSNAA